MNLPAKNLNLDLDIPAADDVPSLQDIVRPIARQIGAVEDVLESFCAANEGVLKDSCGYILLGGGKRIRASIVLFSYYMKSFTGKTENEMRGGRREESAVSIAAAVELIHSATLVHDDLIDRSVLRRLKATVQVHFGDDLAVLLGDYLYAKAFEIIANAGDKEIASWMAGVARVMCEGEIAQINNRYRADVSEHEYFSIIEKKTASLISVCARSGARLAGMSLSEQENLASFGLNLGISFQIVDDILDILGSEKRTGKTLHTDTESGKMTLPLMILARELDNEDKNIFLKNFRAGTISPESLRSLAVEYNIAQKARMYADEYYKKALMCIDNFDNPVKGSLIDLSRFILKRDY